jgi:hypothetical protein
MENFENLQQGYKLAVYQSSEVLLDLHNEIMQICNKAVHALFDSKVT